MVARGRDEGEWGAVFNGHRVSTSEDEKSSGDDGSDGCTTSRLYLLKKFFLVTWCGMWDLSSMTKD